MRDLISRLEKLSHKQLIALVCELSTQHGSSDQPSVPAAGEPIAVVGMSCRFPGTANSCEDYWNLLARGAVAVTGRPEQRWDVAKYLGDAASENRTYTMSAGLLDHIDRFDAKFFNLLPREAETMDPQQRIVLEEIWTALEVAGIPPSSCSGKDYGIFLGVAANEYLGFCRRYGKNEDAGYFASGNVLNMIPGRAAYLLGIHGPVMAIDTACSSSLAAIHAAIGSLNNDECTVAIAGGVNVLLDPDNFVALAKAKMLSPSGYCHTFDERADGYVRAEGCGIVILKKQSAAIAAHDNILAVIHGSAMTHNGRSSSITAPSMKAQQAVIRRALANARWRSIDVDLVEAHGTGTALGDPIELHSLDHVYGSADRQSPLYVSSVKANIGHAEAAAGVAGLIKCVLALQHEMIPRQANFNRLNPNVTLRGDSIVIPTENVAWPRGRSKRACALSSFGFSGINVHMIVGEAPVRSAAHEPQARGHEILALSAKSRAALRQVINDTIGYLEGRGAKERLADICYSVNARKDHYGMRVAVVGDNHVQLASLLRNQLDHGNDHADRTDAPRLILRGISHGTFHLVADIYRRYSSFRRHAAKYDELLLKITALDAERLLKHSAAFPEPSNPRAQVAVSYLLEHLVVDWIARLIPGLTDAIDAVGAGQLAAVSLRAPIDPQLLADAIVEGDATRLPKLILDLDAGLQLASFGAAAASLTLDESTWGVLLRAGTGSVKPAAPSGRDRLSVDLGQITSIEALLGKLAELYARHGTIDWSHLYDDDCRVVECPTYPFERLRHWVAGGPVRSSDQTASRIVVDDLVITNDGASIGPGTYRFTIGGNSPSLLDDHRLFHRIVVPGSFYLALAVEILNKEAGAGRYHFSNVKFLQALTLADDQTREFCAEITPVEASGNRRVFFKSRADAVADYTVHCVATLEPAAQDGGEVQTRWDFTAQRENWRNTGTGAAFYQDFAANGYTLGPRFRCVGDGWANADSVVRKVARPPTSRDGGAWMLDPGLLDSFFQVVGSWEQLRFSTGKLFIPFAIKSFRLIKDDRSSREFWCRMTVERYSGEGAGDESISANLSIYGEDGALCGVVSGFELRAIHRVSIEGSRRSSAIILHETWQAASRQQPAHESRGAAQTPQRRWVLVVGTGHSTADGESTRSDAALPAAGMRRVGSDWFRSDGREAIERLFEEIDAISSNGEYARELHIAFALPSHPLGQQQDAGEQLSAELAGVIRLLQKLIEQESRYDQINVIFLMKDSRPAFAPQNRMYVSLLRCFRQEHPSIRCKVAMLEEGMNLGAALLEQIVARAEAELKFERGQVWSRAIHVMDLDRRSAVQPLELGTCLITGGSGAIGEQLARWLAGQRAVKTLVLLGKRPLDERLERLLLELKQKPVEAYYYCLDLGRRSKVAALTEKLAARGLNVDTIFHAAGIVHDATISNVDDSLAASQLAVKCGAIHCLLDHCRAVRLVVSFSSIASTLGSAGQGVYAAANGFLDALPEHLLERGVRALTVNWGPWSQSGMAARLSAINRHRLESKGIKSLSPCDALDALGALLACDVNGAVVADIDVDSCRRSLPSADRHVFADSAVEDRSSQRDEVWLKQLRSAAPDAALEMLHDFLHATVARITRTSLQEVKQSTLGFYEMGMDSLMIMEFKRAIEEQLHTKLNASVTFNYPQVSKLAQYLLSKIMDRRDEQIGSKPTRSVEPATVTLRRSIDDVARQLERELDADV